MKYYQIALLRSSAPLLTYSYADDIEAGTIVTVPLKNTARQSIVISQVDKPDFQTQRIIEVTDSYYSSQQIEIARFISEYYFSSFSEAVSLFLPFKGLTSDDMSAKQTDLSSADLTPMMQDAGFGVQGESSYERGQVIHDSSLRVKSQNTRPLSVGANMRVLPLNDDEDQITLQSREQAHGSAPTLSPEQQTAYEKILEKERSLLFGVTGSGKTEIFISLMAKMLEEGKSSIFLMPEISLTPQMEKRLKVYFGDSVAMWHSKITKKKKNIILKDIANGKVHIVAGARSALFTPLLDLGLIIVDEEHDDSYKAMTRPRYHARDVAVLMGQKTGAKVVLASATPSAASYHKYDVIKLDKPFVKTKKHYAFISGNSIDKSIIDAIATNYRAGDQSLVFLPTRGNFKYLYCQQCGETHKCPYCSVGMALHRKNRYLKCHYCNYTEPIRESCIACGYSPLSSERIGTAEAIEMITEAIDGIVVEQFDKDSITTANKLKKALERFDRGESHMLLGTQMLSKGHDYANITLSVVTGLDYISGLADFRAKERAMSLLFQIAGRSGRAKEAEVIVQTADPDLYRPYIGDYGRFIKDELEFLQIAGYPPFAVIARILIAHKDESKASRITLDTVSRLKQSDDIEIIGHGKAPIERIANKYRFVILLRAQNRVPLLKALHAVDSREIEVDMDPVEFS